MGKIGMIELARGDLRQASRALDDNDDVSINIAAWHIQQCIEKWLKHQINLHGQRYTRTHSIEILVEEAEDAGVVVPEIVETYAPLLTVWASKARYPGEVLSTKRTLLKIIDACNSSMFEGAIQLSNHF